MRKLGKKMCNYIPIQEKYKMDSETRTFYYIVIVWVLLVLLGSFMHRCCPYRELYRVYTNYVYGDTGPPTDYYGHGNESRNMTASQISIIGFQQRDPSVKSDDFDKPPSYNEDLPTYTEAIEIEKKMDINKKKKISTLPEIISS